MAYEPTALIDALRARDREAIASLLAADVVFASPVATYRGRDEVLRVLEAVSGVIDELRAERELGGDGETVTFVTGRVGEHDVDGVLVQWGDADGCLARLTLMLRPLEGLLAGVKEMARRLG